MAGLITIIGFIIFWVLVQKVILPKLGIAT